MSRATAAGTAKVLVQAETTAASKMQELLGIDKIVAMPTMQAAFDALNNGEQKFLVTDAVIGDYFALQLRERHPHGIPGRGLRHAHLRRDAHAELRAFEWR